MPRTKQNKPSQALEAKLAAKKAPSKKPKLSSSPARGESPSDQPSGSPVPGKPKKPHRFRPGVVALRTIKKEALRVGTCIQRGPFRKLFLEVMISKGGKALRCGKDTMDICQQWVEQLVTEDLSKATTLTTHRGQTTLTASDIAMAQELGGNQDLSDTIRSRLCEAEEIKLLAEKRSEGRKKKTSTAVVSQPA